jgi:hypothetical protein
MRLRCPHHGCPIDVADDMLGARIRCPHCEELLFVDPRYQEGAPAAPEPKPPEPAGPEHRLYAGMPPLAVMLAIRAGRAPDALDRHAEMTADDWQALAAFEKVVRAAVGLKTSLVCGVIALVLTVPSWLAIEQDNATTPFSLGRLGSRVATAVLLIAAFFLLDEGRRRLERLQLGAVVGLAAWIALGVSLVFAVNLLLILPRLAAAGDPSLVVLLVLAIPFQLIAAFDAGKTSLWVRRSLRAVRPPDILHRLTEALRYLQ